MYQQVMTVAMARIIRVSNYLVCLIRITIPKLSGWGVVNVKCHLQDQTKKLYQRKKSAIK